MTQLLSPLLMLLCVHGFSQNSYLGGKADERGGGVAGLLAIAMEF